LTRIHHAAGNDLALAEACDACAASVYAVAVRVTGDASAAQDVLQQVFVQLWTCPERYDPGAAPLRAYLMVLARSRAIDAVRSDTRRLARQERHHRLSLDPRHHHPWTRWLRAKRPDSSARRSACSPRSSATSWNWPVFEGSRTAAAAAGVPEGTATSRLRAAPAALEDVLDHTLLESS